MLLQVTLASAPSTPDSPYPPTPHRSLQPHFAPLALLASKGRPLSRFRGWPTPLPRCSDSMAWKSSGHLSFRRPPSTHIPSLCPRHRRLKHNTMGKDKRERREIENLCG